MRTLVCINRRYYFDKETGEAIIPTREEIRKFYKYDERVRVVYDRLYDKYGVSSSPLDTDPRTPYRTREEAEADRQNRIEHFIDSDLNRVKIKNY